MNQQRYINVISSEFAIEEVVYVLHNTFRVKNNHTLYHALSYENPLQIYLIKPLDTHPRTLAFFNKGILGYEEVFQQYANQVTLLDRSSFKQIRLRPSTLVVMDMHYLKEEKELYNDVLQIVRESGSGLHLVETNVIVPVTETSSKEEYSARTIRSKVHKKISKYLDPVLQTDVRLKGEVEASKILQEFIQLKLPQYSERSNPGNRVTSELSGYLKYGFISVLDIYLQVKDSPYADSFIEELIVRRDLAYNFVFYNPKYYDFYHMTYPWAYNTMSVHRLDEREYLYTIEDYIQFKTHDKYFNTAMKEMVYLGTMHNYMRMYWCKKIVEWSSSHEEAYINAIWLNNHYFIDGNTPNGFAGVAWCFGKHDRAWKEREIFGKLRYMNAKGLERKFDMEQYIKRIEKEVAQYEQ